MFALRLEYLTGRVVATAYNDRDILEWPPHPARLFSALVAVWADSGDRTERAALEWLEQQPAPCIACSNVARRSVLTHYVPVNDTTLLTGLERWREKKERTDKTLEEVKTVLEQSAGADMRTRTRLEKDLERARKAADKARSEYLSAVEKLTVWTGDATDKDRKSAVGLLPESRVRQGRSFPSGVPDDPVIHFIWPDVEPGEHRRALEQLAGRLVNLGHSSCLVHARVVEQVPEAVWIPDDQGDLVMRWVSKGQLQRLESEYGIHKGVEPRVLPFVVQRYRPAAASAACAVPTSVFDHEDWLILRRVGGARLPHTRAIDLARAVRGALMRHAVQPPAAVLSGHEADGSPSRDPHLAIVPLPNVGHKHGDGALLGIALIMPRQLAPEQRRAVLVAIGRWEEEARRQSGHDDDDAPTLTLGLRNGVEIEVERVVWGLPPLYNLRPSTWCGPAREWSSATPVALDRNPGELFSRDKTKRTAAHREVVEILARSCHYAGLPVPEKVVISPGPMLQGSTGARQFPPFPQDNGKFRRILVHAHITFAEPVRGPVLLGAGRFYGLGLFRPIDDDRVA